MLRVMKKVQSTSPVSKEYEEKPQLVLRVGFAGNARLGEADPEVQKRRIGEVLEMIGEDLAAIAPGTDCTRDKEIPKIAKFYSDGLPLLRLVTGLCEGADQLAFEALEELDVRCLQSENAAVIGFDVEAYRASRPPEYQPIFDEHIQQCSYVLQADGIYEKAPKDAPEADQKRGDRKRSRGYRAQSALLLRQSDILVAMIDPEKGGKAGGTLETIQNALSFQIPVVLLNLRSSGVVMLEPGQVLPDELEAGDDANWKDTLSHWITKIVADPELSENTLSEDAALHGQDLLDEYFKALNSADGKPVSCAVSRPNISKLWDWFEGKFQSQAPKGKSTTPTEKPHGLREFERFREPARQLSEHYSGLYRNIFFRNSLFAFIAVLLATLSLLILGEGKSLHQEVGVKMELTQQAEPHQKGTDESGVAEQEEPVPQESSNIKAGSADTPHEESGGHGPKAGESYFSWWVILILFVLAVCKLTLVWKIFRGTHQATHHNWNDRGVDYRYLAERLRTMLYLPSVGSFQPPAASPPQYASRVVRQSAVDWLFDAITRSVSPAGWVKECEVEIEGKAMKVRLIRLEPSETLSGIKDGWLQEQVGYHRENALKTQRMNHWLETLGTMMTFLVIGIVAIDIILLSLKFFHLLHPVLAAATPYIVFFTAVIPALVASLNLVRYQSECKRLAERSVVLERTLGGRIEKASQIEPSPQGGFARLGSMFEKFRILMKLFFGFPPLGERMITDNGKIHEGEILLRHIQENQELGSHCVKVLYYTEGVAEIFVQEVAEWSVLYAKELIEP